MAKRITSTVFYEYEDQWNEWGYKIVGENIVYFSEDRKDQQGSEGTPTYYKDFINNPNVQGELKNWAISYFGYQPE